MQWLWILLMIIIVPTLYLFINKKLKEKEQTSDEPNIIQIFPDYPRDNPYIADPGEIIKFMVKGYIDELDMAEVGLKETDIKWRFQNYVGEIIEKEAGSITYKLPTAKEKQGKKAYVSVTYHGLKDASWLKIKSI